MLLYLTKVTLLFWVPSWWRNHGDAMYADARLSVSLRLSKIFFAMLLTRTYKLLTHSLTPAGTPNSPARVNVPCPAGRYCRLRISPSYWWLLLPDLKRRNKNLFIWTAQPCYWIVMHRESIAVLRCDPAMATSYWIYSILARTWIFCDNVWCRDTIVSTARKRASTRYIQSMEHKTHKEVIFLNIVCL